MPIASEKRTKAISTLFRDIREGLDQKMILSAISLFDHYSVSNEVKDVTLTAMLSLVHVSKFSEQPELTIDDLPLHKFQHLVNFEMISRI